MSAITMIIPSGMEEERVKVMPFHFLRHCNCEARTASRCTNGSREDPGLSKGEDRMYRVWDEDT
jgi:hypothetical protein